MPQQILLDARPVLRKEPENDGEEKDLSSAKVYVKAVEAIYVRKRLNVWGVLEGSTPNQAFQPNILYHLITYFAEEELFVLARDIPADQ